MKYELLIVKLFKGTLCYEDWRNIKRGLKRIFTFNLRARLRDD